MANDGTRILQLVEELNDAFDVFESNLELDECAYFAELPAIDEDLKKAYQQGRICLPVRHYVGREAQDKCKAALRQYKRLDKSVSGRFAALYPGILIAENADTVLHDVALINNIKLEIQACVQDKRRRKVGNNIEYYHARNHLEKHEFLHRYLPNAISYQLYRQVDVINVEATDDEHPLKSTSFYWASKNTDRYLDLSAALQYVTASREMTVNAGVRDELKQKIIDSAPTHRFCLRRTRDDSVNLSLYFGAKANGRPLTKTAVASQPIILINAPDKVKINPMTPRNPQKRRESRRGHAWELLNDKLKLYRRPKTHEEREKASS
ncbi:MAG TPA: hypothetical protein DEH24_00010 [Alteromonas sp.]|nr:hypothetical protein [Alteromonas sp.]|tara:strand:- start:381 stop:1349 length:969 start_codon:yes stop_codon:yes gene_type:complete